MLWSEFVARLRSRFPHHQLGLENAVLMRIVSCEELKPAVVGLLPPHAKSIFERAFRLTTPFDNPQ